MNFNLGKQALLALACSAALGSSAMAQGLDVRVNVAQPVLAGDVDATVTVTVTNTQRSAQLIPKAQLPGQGVDAALFRITRDGAPVDYAGPLVKRGPASEAEHIKLGAGESMSFEVELTGHYDMSRNGQYAIEYVGLNKRHGRAAALQNLPTPTVTTAPTYLWLQGRRDTSATERKEAAPQAAQVTAQATAAATAAPALAFTGNCSSSRKSTLTSAVTAATNYSQAALTYLSGTPKSTPRYKTWFGSFSTTNWNTAKTHFTNLTNAFKTKQVTLDCSCTQNYYAYVYANQPYKIYVCPAFWSAPLTGTDSKAGTLVHEMSHFTVVAGTDDNAYGQSAAKSLATSNPTKALDNADSHEYFAENNPALQ